MGILESASVLGFVGVVIGGLLTIAGQTIGRWAEREHQRRREAAELVASCLMFETSVTQLHDSLNDENLREVRDALTNHITKTSEEFHRRAVMSAISASSSVRYTATKLQVAMATASRYLHPASQQGRSEKFAQKKFFLESMIVRRDALTRVARTSYFFRWPVLIFSMIQISKFHKENGK